MIHVLRYRSSDLDLVVKQINATGYGLTLGIHSRIDETVERIVATAHVGNIYVNRNIVGAVVGVQPFGGEGKSGTGPKAGGPLYLPRLAALGGVDARWVGKDADPVGQATDLVGSEWLLPGPTGERNVLRFVSRGRVLCVAASAADLRAQLQVVTSTGNQPVLLQTQRALAGDLENADWVDDGKVDTLPLAAVLCGLHGNELRQWRQRMAARDGALVPVIMPMAFGYPAFRLLGERVVSVNTTAAGGNTALMTLGQ